MSESKHTKGPWFGSREKPVFVPLKAISCERLGFSIGWVNGHREEEAAANARLIAAAPELLEALKIAQQFMSIASDWNIDEAEIDGEMRSTYDWLEIVNAAIAKATAT